MKFRFNLDNISLLIFNISADLQFLHNSISSQTPEMFEKYLNTSKIISKPFLQKYLIWKSSFHQNNIILLKENLSFNKFRLLLELEDNNYDFLHDEVGMLVFILFDSFLCQVLNVVTPISITLLHIKNLLQLSFNFENI